MEKITRREFLALGAMATAGAVVLSACGLAESELIVQSPPELPEDLLHGEDAWFATTWPDAGGGNGLIARVSGGRVIKLAGNPDHPVNMGRQSVTADAALQLLYHPDRITQPLIRRSKGAVPGPVSWETALREVRAAVQNGAVVATNPMRGHAGLVADNFVERFGGRRINFDPLTQGVLNAAVKRVFNVDVLPDFDIANAATVLSFGADWLSGWLSPTRYSAQYGKFRAGNQRGFLIHIEPRFSVTAANADLWIPAKPGWEGDIAMAIAQVIEDEGLASDAEIGAFKTNLPAGIFFGYQPRDVAVRTGVPEDFIRRAARRFATSRPSMAFGGGSTEAHTNGSFALSAVYALNHLVSSVSAPGGIVLNPASPIPELSGTASGTSFAEWESELSQWRAGFVGAVIIRGADIVYGMPAAVDVKGALNNVPRVIAFAKVMDDTVAEADIILPETTFLEEWGTDVPEPAPGYQTVSFQQPVAGTDPTYEQPRSFGDVLLTVMEDQKNMRRLVSDASNELYRNIGLSGSVRASNRDLFFTGVRQRGGWWNTSSRASGSARPVNPFESSSEPEYSSPGLLTAGQEFHLIPFESNSLANGMLSPTPWAQQIPDPISTIAWTTWAEMNRKDAEQMGVSEGDILLIRSGYGEIQAAAYIHPAATPGVLGIPIGNGMEQGGRYAEGVGANVLKILAPQKDEVTGSLAWASTRVKAVRLGRKIRMPKFEGSVEPFPAEPGVPVLVVAPGETAEHAEEENHHLYQQQFLGKDKTDSSSTTTESHE